MCTIIGSVVSQDPEILDPFDPPIQNSTFEVVQTFNFVDPPIQNDSIDLLRNPVFRSNLAWNQADENGHYHLDDMRLNKHQFLRFFGTEEEKEDLRNAVPDQYLRWKNGIVPYKFSGVSSGNIKKVKKALKIFNKALKGCIKIR